MFEGLTQSVLAGGLTPGRVIVCILASLVFGLGVAGVYKLSDRGGSRSRNFMTTLALLPAVVQIVVMLVNGNIGAGVAVAGAFSLVRFRSIPGNSRDITAIFFAMALGFVTGMGYLFYGFVFLFVIGGAMIVLPALGFARERRNSRVLKITIPENLDYEGLFEDVFAAYTDEVELEQVKTTNMGSLFELVYRVQLKDREAPKGFIDALRTLNGNLNISVSRERVDPAEL